MKQMFFILLVIISFKGFSQSVKIPEIGLEVMTEDLSKSKMGWYQAKKACDSLGDGWRLPTIDELEKIYKFKKKIGDFKKNYYWSSTETTNTSAWYIYFRIGSASNGKSKLQYL